MNLCTTTGLALTTVLIATAVHGGLLTSEPPLLGADGARGTIVYRMGPIHYEPGGWVDTTVTCTNLAATSAKVALEVFDERDERAGALAQAEVAPSASVTFGTSADAGPASIVVVRDLPPVDHGKGRVAASTTQISCTARNRMRADDGSVKESALELVKKVAHASAPAGGPAH
jgi:hypothetical protein